LDGATPGAQGMAAKPMYTAIKIIAGASIKSNLSAAAGMINSLISSFNISAKV
jgi:hypothetical protein